MSKARHIAIIAHIEGPIDYDDAATLESIANILFRNEFGDRFTGLRVSLPDAPPEGECLLEPRETDEKRERRYGRHQVGLAEQTKEGLA